MKTKAGLLAIMVLFLTACGSSEQKPEEQTVVAKQAEKFILKAFNNNYVTVAADFSLVANEPDQAKATMFEKVDKGNGTYGMKTAAAKFVCDDRAKSSQLFADRAESGDWETFEIISLDQTSVNIKTTAGRFVCCDPGKNNILYGDRVEAGEWEKFSLEQR